jgi:hypothetical protein
MTPTQSGRLFAWASVAMWLCGLLPLAYARAGSYFEQPSDVQDGIITLVAGVSLLLLGVAAGIGLVLARAAERVYDHRGDGSNARSGGRPSAATYLPPGLPAPRRGRGLPQAEPIMNAAGTGIATFSTRS